MRWQGPRSWARMALLSSSLVLCCGAVGPTRWAPFGVDLNARPLVALSDPDTVAVVLLFLATDCPISNRYQPEIAALGKHFATQPVRIWTVYPNPYEDAKGVKAHQLAFGQSVSALLDPEQNLVRLAGVHSTPEAAVFRTGSDGLLEAYRGRIDDRYVHLGKQRPQATRHDLADAIDAVLAGKPARAATGGAVGCAIVPLP